MVSGRERFFVSGTKKRLVRVTTVVAIPPSPALG